VTKPRDPIHVHVITLPWSPPRRAVPELRHRNQYLDAHSPSLLLPSVSHQCPSALLASFLFCLAETGLCAVFFTVQGSSGLVVLLPKVRRLPGRPQQATADQRQILAGLEWQQQASAAFLVFGKVETPPKP